MANREELGIIRGARGGNAAAQLELGKLYLFGSTGLPRSLPTALHWLERAAQQECGEACELIGAHIPIELASQSQRPLAPWYERALDSGVMRAGIVFAQLVLAEPGVRQDVRAKALRALEAAAGAGFADAAELLTQQRRARSGGNVQPVLACLASGPMEQVPSASSLPWPTLPGRRATGRPTSRLPCRRRGRW